VDDDRVWLVREVLEECKGGTVDDLRDHLTVALQQDLIDIDGPGPLRPSGALTKMLCARAVQLEILQDELKILDEASRQDRLAGATSAPLDLPLAGGRLHDAIMMLREKPTLPERLDARDKMEIGSTLGLRTATHVAFVTLAALRHAKIPFAKALYILRALLFPVMGAVSRIAWYRLVVVIGFWGAALYLTSRVLAMPSGKASTPATLGEAVSCPVLLSYAALLAVMGVVAMPALRAWAGGSVLRRVGQGVCAAILLAVGAGIVIGMALGPGHAAAARLLVTAGSTAVPPDVLKDALMAVLFGLPLARLLPGVRGKIADSLDSSRWTGAAFAGAFAVLMGWLVAWAMVEHVGAFLDGDGPWWKVVAAWTAFAAAPVAVGIYLAISAIADKVK
jgi:hypothetical protein